MLSSDRGQPLFSIDFQAAASGEFNSKGSKNPLSGLSFSRAFFMIVISKSGDYKSSSRFARSG
jgi:hypothetical protein